MPKLKNLSGKEIIKILEELGFEILHYRGSHCKLRRFDSLNNKQTLTVPVLNNLKKGTIKAILNQASHFVSEEKLREKFYNK